MKTTLKTIKRYHNANGKGLFTSSNSITMTITNVMLASKIGMQPILSVRVLVKKMPPVNVTVTVTESFGVNRLLVS